MRDRCYRMHRKWRRSSRSSWRQLLQAQAVQSSPPSPSPSPTCLPSLSPSDPFPGPSLYKRELQHHLKFHADRRTLSPSTFQPAMQNPLAFLHRLLYLQLLRTRVDIVSFSACLILAGRLLGFLPIHLPCPPDAKLKCWERSSSTQLSNQVPNRSKAVALISYAPPPFPSPQEHQRIQTN